MATILVLLAFVVCFVTIFCHWSWNIRTSYSIRNWPLLGMLPMLLQKQVFSNFHEFVTQVCKRHERTTFVFKGPWFSNMNFVMTCDPLNIHHMCSKNFANYPKGSHFNMIFMEAFGDGIFNADDDLWRIQRRILHSALRHEKFQSTLEKTMLQKVEKGLVPILDHASKLASIIDIQDVFKRVTFDTICIMVLGYDPDCVAVGSHDRLAYMKAYDVIEKCLFYRHMMPQGNWQLMKWLQIGMERRYSRALKTFDEFLYKCISLKQQEISRRKTTLMEEEAFDLLTAFMVEEDDKQMVCLRKSDKFLRDISLNLLMAGKDSVSAGLSWFFWLVANHPSAEKRILEEIEENITAGKDGKERLLSRAEELKKMVYLHAALCEALRLYPSIPVNHKAAAKPDILPSGHHVNQGTRILFFSYPMARMEEIWGKDCLQFKPERWISKQGRIIHVPSYKFIAFNAGPRTCTGKDLSFILMKMVATTVIWRYKVQVVEGHHVSPENSMILQMKHGLKVRVSKRHLG